MTDALIVQYIQRSQFLSPGDKGFLIDNLKNLSPLEKLKLQANLRSGLKPDLLENLNNIRTKFIQSETPKKPDIFNKLADMVVGKKPKQIVAKSLLTQPELLGSPIPQPIKNQRVNQLKNLQDFYHPAQLSQLDQFHINFNLNSNTEQIMHNFLNKLHKTFEDIEDINLKRAYFMNFVESKLFSKYLNTALTALRHPELQPSKIVLNLLSQINQNYLNNKQFSLASVISNHLRNICGI